MPDQQAEHALREDFLGVEGSRPHDLPPEVQRQFARVRQEQLEARGPVTVLLPHGCVIVAAAQDRTGTERVELATSGEVEVPAGMLLSLTLNGADEHADAVATLQRMPADVLGLLAIEDLGARTMHTVAMIDWPRLMPPVPGRREIGEGAMQLRLATADVTTLAARWPSALRLVLPAGPAPNDSVDGVLLHGVEALEVRCDSPVGWLLTRLPQVAPDLASLVVECTSLDEDDWSTLHGLGSLRSLSVYDDHEPPTPPVPVGAGATELLEVALSLPGLHELTLHTTDAIGRVADTGFSVSLEQLLIGAAAVDGSTVVSTSRLSRLRVLSVDGVDDDTSRADLMALLARDNGVLPDLVELNLRNGDIEADDPVAVLDAEDALAGARSGLLLNGIEFAASVRR